MSSNVALSQTIHLLNLVHKKGIPAEQLQELFNSGLLSDLLDANIGNVRRNEFRKLIGCGPIFRIDQDGRILLKLIATGWTGEQWLNHAESRHWAVGTYADELLSDAAYDTKHRLQAGTEHIVMLVPGRVISEGGQRTTANLRRSFREYGMSKYIKGELALLVYEVMFIFPEKITELLGEGIEYGAVLHDTLRTDDNDFVFGVSPLDHQSLVPMVSAINVNAIDCSSTYGGKGFFVFPVNKRHWDMLR